MSDKINKKFNQIELTILFFIWPLVAVYRAIRNFRSKSARFVLVIFGIFYGYTFIPIENSDADTYRERLQIYSDYSVTDYVTEVVEIFSGRSEFVDFYSFHLLVFVNMLGGNSQLFYAMAAMVYYYLIVRFLAMIFDISTSSTNLLKIVSFVGIVFLVNLSAGINGIRWPLALFTFVFGAAGYILKEQKKYLFLVLVAMFIHFALLYPLVIFSLFIMLKKLNGKYLPLIITFSAFILVPFISSTFIDNIHLLGDGSIENQASGYLTNEQYKLSREEHLGDWNWYLSFDRFSTYYYLLFSFLVIKLTRINVVQTRLTLSLELLFALFFVGSLIAEQLIDVISNRYYLVANAFGLLYLYFLADANQTNRILSLLGYLYLPIVLLHALIVLRADFYTVSPILIFGNPILAIFYRFEVDIQTLILG